MVSRQSHGRRASLERGHSRRQSREVPRIEAYETEDGTVIFDGENPLAWVHSNHPVPLHQQA